jgi:hypothetical protein
MFVEDEDEDTIIIKFMRSNYWKVRYEVKEDNV